MENDYPTCAKTYATLRIYPEHFGPEVVSKRLEIEPTSWQRRGEPRTSVTSQPLVYKLHGWFLTTMGVVQSRDVRQHLDWLLERLALKAEELRLLREDGCEMDVSCYWLSQSGHGGPIVTPAQMGDLARLGLELWFDVYFAGGDSA